MTTSRRHQTGNAWTSFETRSPNQALRCARIDSAVEVGRRPMNRLPLDLPFTVAAVQAAPVFMDREATIAKACEFIHEAGSQGARVIVFPEAFIPAYPDWVWAIPAGDGATLDE